MKTEQQYDKIFDKKLASGLKCYQIVTPPDFDAKVFTSIEQVRLKHCMLNEYFISVLAFSTGFISLFLISKTMLWPCKEFIADIRSLFLINLNSMPLSFEVVLAGAVVFALYSFFLAED